MRPGPEDPHQIRRFWQRPIAFGLAAVLVAVLAIAGGATFIAQTSSDSPRAPVSLAPSGGDGDDSELIAERESGDGAAPATVSPSASPTPTGTPTPDPTPVAASVELRPGAVGPGETMAIEVHGGDATAAHAIMDDLRYPLAPEPDGSLWGLIGVPLGAALGETALTVVLTDAAGAEIERREVPYEVTSVDRPVDELTLNEEQGSVLSPEASQLNYEMRVEQFTSFDSGRRWSEPFIMPVEGIFTTQFGQGRSINGGPVGGFHGGSDIANDEGTSIVAAGPGRVSWAGEMPIHGNTVIIDHGAGVKTGYHHLSTIGVEVNDTVEAGDAIGAMGSTGLSTGPHLHWELTIYGVTVDPVAWTETGFGPRTGLAAAPSAD